MANLESQGVTIFWATAVASTNCSTAAGGKIGQIMSFNGPTGSAGKIDVTNLDSTAKEFLMGLRDEGDISMEVHYDPADVGHIAAFADRGTRTLRNWLIQLTDGSSNNIKGQGYMTGFAVTGSVDDSVKASMTIAITGAVYISTGTTIGA